MKRAFGYLLLFAPVITLLGFIVLSGGWKGVFALLMACLLLGVVFLGACLLDEDK